MTSKDRHGSKEEGGGGKEHGGGGRGGRQQQQQQQQQQHQQQHEQERRWQEAMDASHSGMEEDEDEDEEGDVSMGGPPAFRPPHLQRTSPLVHYCEEDEDEDAEQQHHGHGDDDDWHHSPFAVGGGFGGGFGGGGEHYDDTSIFENKAGLSDDMRFLASMPELCDVTFLVGETREPVCAVKAVLGARSKVFHKLVYTQPKEPPKEKEAAGMKATSKLRAFIKRSSEPLLNMQPQPKFTSSLSTVVEPYSSSSSSDYPQHQTLIIEEFEPDVFRQLIEYIHTGCVTLQPRTLLGVMNAADYYGLEELKKACSGFIQCCVNVDTVCALLATAERYIQYKCTKTLVQKVLEFVDEHGNEVLNLGSFALLPQHVVRLILARDELKADEFSKFQAALMWSKKYCDSTNSNLEEVMGSFLEYIDFHMIPAKLIMNEIYPLALVDPEVIMKALAYQADPQSAELCGAGPGGSAAAATAAAGTGAGAAERKAAASTGDSAASSTVGMPAKTSRTGTVRHRKSAASVGGLGVGSAAAAAAAAGRSMSVQSARGPFGSNTTLSSSTSSANMNQAADTLSVDVPSTTQSVHSPSRCSSVSRYSN